ncbi:acyl-ACP--UDP-N-acetylglucosamine O-acyltransferase [Glaciimonas sp. CA11.2]|uniref:acyl-ACP--UDP-N-acetylglucosamine O-acyltransferase n=1 Tax=unclassified Glaciimonas TaxID=2644401 RepID=UPI002AB41182|nr:MULTISPECIES: acyl-ACP--UDP-N-acetylglucosamine O-acyltransferase [unclassified Glaciimonas]MDY7548841.1 acyl-ACP--UDP-N-acetylglucosamine O-acyltransferase [Glaciimonas sp. CA11.2]MEB0012487.1 acyl-ACP--UDP-N-acetylglucosamine O-acyltransferase [Glaciimonas sp. Cout2]MEB0082584.1 acyl-ACP--UDP-N-acetylglucosamine O-acyltransferase [Glaciimonas sp. Gout2]MEB0163748.1 acyl-ACP--UDP-N-acetylglucosamine O-acyltransferase [Glaciimonas sp. CA11.2]
MSRIHSTAVVDSRAVLDSTVEVGAYSIIGPNVTIDAGTKVGPHVVIEGHTSIGRDNTFFQFGSIGAAPQDKKYAGEPTRLEIGSGNTIREFVTLNLGTSQDVGVTRLGDDNWVMAYVHVAHDCQIGSHTVIANNATLAGHVHVGDWVLLGGFTTIHQFCRIGPHAMTAFTAAVSQDVPPFVTAAGNRAVPAGINSEGLRRRGFSSEQVMTIKRAYRLIYRSGLPLEEAKAALEAEELKSPDSAEYVRMLREFISSSQRGIIR